MSLIANIILGIPLLIWGRKLFWLFVGTVGFISGFWLGQRFLVVQEEWIIIGLGIVLGLMGILFAVMVQKFAVTITGFLAGVYLMYTMMDNINLSLGPWDIFVYLAGGMLSTLLVLSLFDWALIILSSLVGAAMISQISFDMVRFEGGPRTLIFIVLLVIGLIVQYEQKQREP